MSGLQAAIAASGYAVQGPLRAVHAQRQAHLGEEPAALPHGRLEPIPPKLLHSGERQLSRRRPFLTIWAFVQ